MAKEALTSLRSGLRRRLGVQLSNLDLCFPSFGIWTELPYIQTLNIMFGRGLASSRAALAPRHALRKGKHVRVAIRLPVGVAVQWRGSVSSRSTDSERVGEVPYSPNCPLSARSRPLPAEGRGTKVRVNQCGVQTSSLSHREGRAGRL